MSKIRDDIARVPDKYQRDCMTAMVDAGIGQMAWNSLTVCNFEKGVKHYGLSPAGYTLFNHIRAIQAD